MRMTRMSLLPTNSTVPTSILFRNPQDTICDSLSISDWSAISSLLIYVPINTPVNEEPATKTIYLCLGIYLVWILAFLSISPRITNYTLVGLLVALSPKSIIAVQNNIGIGIEDEGGFFRLNRWKNLRSSIPQGLSKNQINWIPWFEIQPKVKEQEEYHCLKYLNMQIIWSTFLFSNQEDCPNKIELILICSDWTCLAEESN